MLPPGICLFVLIDGWQQANLVDFPVRMSVCHPLQLCLTIVISAALILSDSGEDGETLLQISVCLAVCSHMPEVVGVRHLMFHPTPHFVHGPVLTLCMCFPMHVHVKRAVTTQHKHCQL